MKKLNIGSLILNLAGKTIDGQQTGKKFSVREIISNELATALPRTQLDAALNSSLAATIFNWPGEEVELSDEDLSRIRESLKQNRAEYSSLFLSQAYKTLEETK